jgi:hypothetical protein
MTRTPAHRPPSFMSRKELAWELSVSESTIDELVRLRVIPSHYEPVATEPFWEWNDVLDWLDLRPHCGTVYVVGFASYRKIGHTNRPTPMRYMSIQNGCPERLVVFREFPGGRPLEQELHRRFAPLRTSGEWYRCEGKLAAWIDAGCPCEGAGT